MKTKKLSLYKVLQNSPNAASRRLTWMDKYCCLCFHDSDTLMLMAGIISRLPIYYSSLFQQTNHCHGEEERKEENRMIFSFYRIYYSEDVNKSLHLRKNKYGISLQKFCNHFPKNN
jgi:hypothetical protein